MGYDSTMMTPLHTPEARADAHALLAERLSCREAALVLLGIASAGGSLEAARVAARALSQESDPSIDAYAAA